MTSIYNIQNNQYTNLNDFINGYIGEHPTVREEKGFQVTGNVGALLNSNPDYLKKINEGIMFNPQNITDNSQTFIGKIKPMKNDWSLFKQPQPPTPLQYCNEQPLSELLPYYPNGIPNKLLNPTCKMQLNGVAAPQLYGGSTAFVNNDDVVNNPNNNIGYELDPYGISNNNGLRAIGQNNYSCNILRPGHNVPNLGIQTNINNAYVAEPYSFNKDVPLYQTGDWTKLPGNFINNYINNIGDCKRPEPIPSSRPEPIPSSRPQPIPSSRPQPIPSSRPQPIPSSRPEPIPSSRPEPIPSSRPEPTPSSRPEPIPKAMPRPSYTL